MGVLCVRRCNNTSTQIPGLQTEGESSGWDKVLLSLVWDMWTVDTGDTDTGPGHMELERELAAQWAELTRGRATPLASLVTVQGAGRGLRAEQEMQGGQVRLSRI